MRITAEAEGEAEKMKAAAAEVRYSVAFIASTFGSSAASSIKSTTLSKDSYGW